MRSMADHISGQIVRTGIDRLPVKPQTKTKPAQSSVSFQDLLQTGKDEELKISKHARKRIASREIDLKEADVLRLKEVIARLEAKGARDSLVLMKNGVNQNCAFVVSVKNRTIITAMSEAVMRENVFTNIDSTVIL